VIQARIEEIKIFSPRVALKPQIQILVNLRYALETTPITANESQQYDGLQRIPRRQMAVGLFLASIENATPRTS
jgi:hypothetical protein